MMLCTVLYCTPQLLSCWMRQHTPEPDTVHKASTQWAIVFCRTPVLCHSQGHHSHFLVQTEACAYLSWRNSTCVAMPAWFIITCFPTKEKKMFWQFRKVADIWYCECCLSSCMWKLSETIKFLWNYMVLLFFALQSFRHVTVGDGLSVTCWLSVSFTGTLE